MALLALREDFKKWSFILWIVIIALSLYVFANWGAQGKIGQPTSVIAWVGGDEILFKEYVEQFRSLEDRYKQMYGNRYTSDMAKMLGIDRQAISNLVDTRVILHEAKKMGVHVSKEEIAKKILSMRMFTNDKGEFIGYDKYKRYVEGYGKTIPDFEKSIGNDELITKLGDLVSNSITLTDDQVKKIYRDQNEKIGFEYVSFKAQTYMGEALKEVTNDEAEKYYGSHKDAYRTPLKRSISFVRFTPFEFKKDMQVSDKEIKAYYKEHIDKYTQKEQVRASHILIGVTVKKRSFAEAKKIADKVYAQLKKGKDFKSLVQKYSDDYTTVKKGGDLNWFPKGRMVKAFEAAAFGMKVGEYSKPVKTQFGYHIIKVTGHKEGKIETLEEARSHIESDLKFKKAQELVQKKAVEFSKAAKEKKDLAVAAKAMKYTVIESGFFANDPMATINGIGPSARVANATFSLKIKDISDPLKTAEGVIVFQVMGEKDPEIPPFEKVAGKVKNDIAKIKAQALARQAAEKFRAGVTPKNFETLVKKEGMKIQKIDPVTRQSAPANFIVKKSSDSFEKLFSYDNGQFTEPLTDRNGDTILCRITDKVPFDQKDFMAKAQDMKAKEIQRRSNDLFTSFIRNARKSMEDAGKIKISQRFQETQLDNKK
ncbi:MAG: hypothetical protein CO090_09025 [Acidobacteria bacterium CG_4_9_14_3_um_filter_49_7]|nr:MAG: hypothetical protein CO090_09025 [Acidobacteria bacterium CG_4_9_14_3_um_filter_49_7]